MNQKDVKGIGCGLFKALSLHFLGETEENHKISCRSWPPG
jgi:hypothetical protein